MKQCVECKATSPGNVWRSGEVCLFGMLFACSLACAEKYAAENAKEGFRPGEPGFDADVEPAHPCGDCGDDGTNGFHACQGVPGGFGNDDED